ncbi:phage portal protein [Corynebacterium sp. KPL2838]|uniref:phage portal protein n=1 Tax=Corynebacterium sp. KPL2838 TaxID=3158316 RepID=UPI0032EEECF9
MGIISRIKEALNAPALYHPNAIASPLSSGDILAPVFAGLDMPSLDGAVTRDMAMAVPALARARTLICSTIAGVPLVSVDKSGDDDGRTPDYIETTYGDVSPYHRMLWTIDDLFFHGWSLWAVERDNHGLVIDAARVPFEMWSLDQDGNVLVDGQPARADDVCLIPGISEGILTTGRSSIAQAHQLLRAAARAADNPSAQVELHQTNDAPMTEEDVDRLIARWARARAGENGGVAYTSNGIEVKEHGASSEHLLIEGRNAAAVDIARHANLPATMVDATLSGSSLSYQNTAARMSELVTFGLSPLMNAVAARLSQNDMTAPNIRLRFDLDQTFEDLSRVYQIQKQEEQNNEPNP